MTKSLEDYLEAIHRHAQEAGGARVVDIAHALGVKMPSVNNAVKELAKLGYVEYERYHRLKTTPEGERRAQTIYRRHKLLKDFLLAAGVSEAHAETDACAIDDILSAETPGRLKDLMRRMTPAHPAPTDEVPVCRRPLRPCLPFLAPAVGLLLA